MTDLLETSRIGFRFVQLSKLALLLMAGLVVFGAVLGAFEIMVPEYVKLCFYYMNVALAVVTGKGIDNLIERVKGSGKKE